MLADAIMELPALLRLTGQDDRDANELALAVAAAQKFALDEFAAGAVAHVASSRPSTILAALPACRVPFESVWIEFMAKDMRLGRKPIPGLKEPERTGFLIQSEPPFTSGQVVVAWQHTGHPAQQSPFGLFFTVDRTIRESYPRMRIFDYDKEDVKSVTGSRELPYNDNADLVAYAALNEYAALIPALYQQLAWERIEAMPLERRRQLLEQWAQDVRGEIYAVLAALAIINSHRSITIGTDDYSKLNRRRTKVGKLPLFEFHRLTLRLSEARRAVGRRSGASLAIVRQHQVRGHFKVRKSGIYFWSPHLRGDRSAGFVDKDYDVKGQSN